jgi:hypothetical protein
MEEPGLMMEAQIHGTVESMKRKDDDDRQLARYSNFIFHARSYVHTFMVCQDVNGAIELGSVRHWLNQIVYPY